MHSLRLTVGSPGSSQAWGFAVELGKISLLTDDVPPQGILGLSLLFLSVILHLSLCCEGALSLPTAPKTCATEVA